MLPVLRFTTLRGPGVGLRRLVYVTVIALLVAASACAGTTPSEPSTLEISTQPASQYVSPGRTATLTVGVAAMTTPKYQWYIGSSGTTTTPIPGAKSNSYTTPALLTTTSYWVRVTDGSETADSATAVVTVFSGSPPVGPPAPETSPKITIQPQSQTLSPGRTATLSVAATGTAVLRYQWYLGPSGTTSSLINGATAASYTTPVITATTSYWVRVTNGAGAADSAAAVVTVPPPVESAAFEDHVLLLVNQRRAAGATCGTEIYPAVPAIVMNPALRRSARSHSVEMATYDFLSRDSLDGRTFDKRMSDGGYSGAQPWAESIALGPTTPGGVVVAWMADVGRCAVIMSSRFRVAGVGYAYRVDSSTGYYWTMDFGGS